MIQHGSVLEELPKELEHRPYAEALAGACEIAGFSEVKKQIYVSDMMSERDIEAKCKYAFEDGEANKARSVAANMLAEGLPANQIARCTGLTEEEVKALRAS